MESEQQVAGREGPYGPPREPWILPASPGEAPRALLGFAIMVAPVFMPNFSSMVEMTSFGIALLLSIQLCALLTVLRARGGKLLAAAMSLLLLVGMLPFAVPFLEGDWVLPNPVVTHTPLYHRFMESRFEADLRQMRDPDGASGPGTPPPDPPGGGPGVRRVRAVPG
ncbi:MAG: hypothetical protein SF028_05185 [Candidatus Sumerlaeia bacterium]|nr:hypothetical protein [Candidatus Sumerlaeia bacterium]